METTIMGMSQYTISDERRAELAREFGLAWPSVISPVEFAIMDKLSKMADAPGAQKGETERAKP